MFTTGAFNPAAMGFQFPGQQPAPPIYQSQYGGFNPQIPPQFQQGPPSRGQSLPASVRQYAPSGGPYAPGPSSRRHGQYPPSGPPQHKESRKSHRSKSKKHQKRRSVSPEDVADQDLYSDKEQREPSNEQNVQKSSEDRSRSQSPAEENANKDQQQSQAVESVSGEGSQGGTAGAEEEQQRGNEKHKSSSKKKKHHRRDRYEQYNAHLQQQQQQQQPPPGFYGNFQNNLPPHLTAHHQPIYSGYNQGYEESLQQRGDGYGKQAKHSTRLPSENNQQQFSFAPVQGYPQQPFGAVRPPFNPYQPYGPQPGFYGSAPAPPPSYNPLQVWPTAGGVNNPADHEIQRLRSHIHSLEGELHKLQKKLTKTTLNTNEASGQDETNRSHRRSKRDDVGTPRQTPVIVELNNTTGETIRESSSKKHRRRTGSNTSSQQGPNPAQQDVASTQRSGENVTGQEGTLSSGNAPNQQEVDSRERSRSGGNQIAESEDRQGKQSSAKTPREETAAQLAQAAAAHVNGRQGLAQQQQQQVPPPPPVPRQQVPVQQQYLYQQGAVPVQAQQIRGPASYLPPGVNVQYPGDPYQQQQQQQYNLSNPNYNQSNNNELFDDNEERRKQDSAEKILDAFERSFVNHGRSTIIPMKVKYIPEENNSNLKRSNHQQRNMNNNNNHQYRSTSRRSNSSLSTWSSSDRLSSRHFNKKTTRSCDA